MNDQQLAALIGIITVAAVRVLDWILPRGHYFKIVRRYSTDDEEDQQKKKRETS